MVWITVNGRHMRTGWAEENAERKDRARDEWHKTWVTHSRLKFARNWTDSTIKKYLSKPTISDGYKLYKMKKVLAAEALPEFMEWMTKRIEKQKERKNL